MKRKCFILLFTILLTLIIPLTVFAEETPDPSPVPSQTPKLTAATTPDTTSPTTSPTDTPDMDTPEPVISAGQLTIDSKNLYPGMNKTYENGYIPIVKDGNVSIVLPLIGKTQDGKVTLSADLGQTTDSPFVFGNYAQTRESGEPYVFTISIPLASGRINGVYPVTLSASYLDTSGSLMTQTFIIYVTITDGSEPIDPNAIEDAVSTKETVDKPELFISSCEINPGSVGGNEEFEVTLTVENIGTLRARSVRLTYGSTSSGGDGAAVASSIVPVATNNAIHLENIADGKSETASFKLKTTADVISGNQPFSVTLDYTDAYGGVYTSSRTFLIAVTQPADFTYDDIVAVIPESVTAGESFVLPANVYNTGKSTLKNVMIEVTGEGLFPKSAACSSKVT